MHRWMILLSPQHSTLDSMTFYIALFDQCGDIFSYGGTRGHNHDIDAVSVLHVAIIQGIAIQDQYQVNNSIPPSHCVPFPAIQTLGRQDTGYLCPISCWYSFVPLILPIRPQSPVKDTGPHCDFVPHNCLPHAFNNLRRAYRIFPSD